MPQPYSQPAKPTHVLIFNAIILRFVPVSIEWVDSYSLNFKNRVRAAKLMARVDRPKPS